ncbi:competence/damage-inducible protein A [Halobacteriales archaeon QS_5_70_15]|nr:MAG: competence/damage-inducible protein A [Halobacteriales archaeon QS_5_70_15]
MDAAIVTVGDELLAGDTENTNATWLCRELSERGVTVKRTLTVPDEIGAIAENVRAYAEAYDAVVVTGGLGGTPDDVTMAGVARAFDRPMEPNDLARADLERSLAALAEERPELDLDVDVEAEASIPAGARPLINDAGLSPGCVIEPEGGGSSSGGGSPSGRSSGQRGGDTASSRTAEPSRGPREDDAGGAPSEQSSDGNHGAVYVLPGIPGEMTSMFEGVAEEFAGAVRSAVLYTEEPEANLIARLDEVRERFGVGVGCYPDRDAGHNRLKLRAEDGAALGAARDWLAANVETIGYDRD